MSLSQLDFLRHILDEVNFCIQSTENETLESLIENEILKRAVIRSLEIIGEATKKLSEEFTTSYPQIDWKKIAGTRDKLIHHYFGVDYEIVWDIIINRLPELNSELERIIRLEENK